MPVYSKPRLIWRAVYPLLLIWFIADTVFFLSGIALTAATGINELSGSVVSQDWFFNEFLNDEWEYFFGVYGWWIDAAASVIAMAVFSNMLHKTKARGAYAGGRIGFENIGLIVVATIGVYLYLSYFYPLAFLLDFFPEYETIAADFGTGSLASRIMAIGIAGPIAEELCFRGVIHNRLKAWLPVWAAVLLQNVLFGIFHQNGYQAIYTFIAGILFTLLYQRYNTLAAPVVAHMAFNLTGIFLDELYYWTDAADLTYSALVLPELVFLPLMLVSVLCVRKIIRNTTPQPVLSLEQNTDRSLP